MVAFSQAFQKLTSKTVVVIGDFMCDLYTKGKAKRVSPEAPVVVLNVESQERLAGGAGNVVFNLKSLGATVYPIGLLGNDDEGSSLLRLFNQAAIDTTGIVLSDQVQTIIKNRVIADSQHLVRIDLERPYIMEENLEDQMIEHLIRFVSKADIVAISDYQKGFLTEKILRACIETAKFYHIPVIVDPKGLDFSKYRGATLIKPNVQEAYQASKSSPSISVRDVAKKLLEEKYCEAYIITRSEEGMAYFSSSGEELYFPVEVKEVVDVTGAGDTALAMITLCLANGLKPDEMIPLANIAASIAVEKLGCAHVSLEQVASRLLELSINNKFVPAEGWDLFYSIIRNQQYQIFLLDEVERFDIENLEVLKKSLLKDPGLKKIIYLKKTKKNSIVLQILASYQEVDYILVDRMGIEKLIEKVPPETIEFVSPIQVTSLKLEDLFQVLV